MTIKRYILGNESLVPSTFTYTIVYPINLGPKSPEILLLLIRLVIGVF